MGKKTEAVLAAMQKYHNWSPREIGKLRTIALNIAHTESLNNPEAYQMEGGPGRGKYQVEVGAGKGSGTNKVYVQRYRNFLKDHGIEDVLDAADWRVLNSPDPDFAQLSSDTQDALFFASMDRGPAKMADIASGKLSGRDFWLKFHWAGPDKDKPARIKHWDDTMRSLNHGRRWRETQPDSAPDQEPNVSTLAGVREEAQTGESQT